MYSYCCAQLHPNILFCCVQEKEMENWHKEQVAYLHVLRFHVSVHLSSTILCPFTISPFSAAASSSLFLLSSCLLFSFWFSFPLRSSPSPECWPADHSHATTLLLSFLQLSSDTSYRATHSCWLTCEATSFCSFGKKCCSPYLNFI